MTETRSPNRWAILLVLLGGAAAAVGAGGVDLSNLRHPPLGHLAALVAGGSAALFGLANLFRRTR